MQKQIVFLSLLLFLSASAASARQPEAKMPLYDLSVAFNVPASRLSGMAKLEIEAGTTTFDVAGLLITGMTLDDMPVKPDVKDGKITVKAERRGMLSIQYEAGFKGDSPAAGESGTGNMIGSQGIALGGSWYPAVRGLARYRLRAVLPKGYEALSEADEIVRSTKGNETEFEFRFESPSEGITFIASDKYEIVQDNLNGTSLYAYVFQENREHAERHLRQVKKYLESYGNSLAPYPYKRLSIADYPLAAAQSRPTMVLLGPDMAALSAVPETFLSREVLSQWFGCSVYVDREKGDWADGLISYMTGRRPAEVSGTDWEFRKQMMAEYGIFADRGNGISLREYTGGIDGVNRAIGRRKGSLVFHMLEREVGEDAFIAAIRTFLAEKQHQKASWDDIRTEVEKKSGRDLAGFFAQWVEGKELPELTAGKPAVRRKGELFEISFDLSQNGISREMDLPVQVSLADGSSREQALRLAPDKKRYTLNVDREPRTLVMDRDYETARRLTDAETPPVLSGFLGGQKFLIALPESGGEAYAPVIAALKQWGGGEKKAQDITNESMKQASVAVLGRDNPLIQALFGKIDQPNAGFSVTARKNPWNEDEVIAVFDAQSSSQADAAMLKLSEYGKFSRVAFNEGVNVLKATDDSQRGIKMELRQPPAAVDLSALRTYDDIIEAAATKKIVYVGEYHDKYAHHAVQLDIIRGLFEKNPKLAIGMEMFQRPFQKVVDDYINGAIDERAFLQGTEYFKRWVYDYNLYKPILDFARSNKIPVVALNQRKEITEKVSKSGLDSLTAEERSDIPREMDFSDNEYRERLKTIFDMHKRPGGKPFDNFYSAQILWDETMALSVDEFLRKNPDFSMVVIAGGGHLAFGSGIPKRAFRRNSLPYTIILNDGDVDKNIADYLIMPQDLEGVEAPRLMAMLQAAEKRITVTSFAENSELKRAGIRTGDTILAVDGEPVESVEDIKLALFYKQKGEILKVKVLRKRLLFSDKEMEFEVHL